MTEARIYIDCEFNGWMGELISFAMVSDDGREFYSVLPEPSTWDKWCLENVLPVLGKKPAASADDFRVSFLAFLRGFRNPIIVADWPADLYYFNKVLLGTGHEESILYPCRMELVGCDITSAVPHNALEDARAIRDALEKRLTHEWQPIETAPKDGTWVDGWAVNTVKGTTIGRLTDIRFIDGAWWRGPRDDTAWEVEVPIFTETGQPVVRITHWMPLPVIPLAL